ncbi:XPG-I-2 domain-containing protein [Mycena kentingensis (nom. inval.)]|nr:XPG-I-2 domain-containing protein [Mycena kentingensis (nom. inval.)]
MGVLGLATFLRENPKLSQTHTISAGDNSPRINVVVDGWSFIYDIHKAASLPWAYGGEYDKLLAHVKTVARAWVDVGLNLHFVFDGAEPAIKFTTLISRLTSTNITNAQVFFRTSATSRSNARFLHETRILPPLCYFACVQALLELSEENEAIVVHFADAEADPWAVELAGRLGAFVVGSDSDFVILNADNYRGYLPLESMSFTDMDATTHDHAEHDDDGFQQIVNPKLRKKQEAAKMSALRRGIIPPEGATRLALTFSTYTPAALAAHLKIPVPLLPLLGALVGNDFTNQSSSPHKNVQQLFFERQLSLGQRITRVANTIHSILSTSSLKGKQKQVESVMDLIHRAVNALLVRSVSSMGSGEIEEIIDRIVESTLQYALPRNEEEFITLWPTEICALHEADVCPALPMFSRLVTAEAMKEDRNDDDELLKRNDVRGRYLAAYRQGRLHAKVLDVLSTQTFWPRIFLEEPNLETVSRVMGRPIREWGYAILHDALGLPLPPEAVEDPDADSGEDEVQGGDEEDDPEDEDELIDVVESDSEDELPRRDLLAPLRGALKQLNGDETSQELAAQPAVPPAPPRHLPPPTVTEYLRRGTRIAEEPIPVPSLVDLLGSISSIELVNIETEPLVLQPEEHRFTLLLRVLKSDTNAIRTLPREQLLPVLALRWVLQTLRDRALESDGNKDREKERWTRKEAQSFLSAFSWTTTTLRDAPTPQRFPELHDRNVQLAAQVLTTLEAIEHFSQILLITERLPSPVSLFSGVEFHANLTGTRMGAVDLPGLLWDACVADIPDAFADEAKRKKPKKAKNKAAPSPPNGAGYGPRKGLFDLLVDA